ncbi:MAG: hypothetical protein DI570_09940 [Phenylobacterium zucineum]|nr:MAG: hypothetical protein DI570_09940 [Phenylobacterium zucineum]
MARPYGEADLVRGVAVLTALLLSFSCSLAHAVTLTGSLDGGEFGAWFNEPIYTLEHGAYRATLTFDNTPLYGDIGINLYHHRDWDLLTGEHIGGQESDWFLGASVAPAGGTTTFKIPRPYVEYWDFWGLPAKTEGYYYAYVFLQLDVDPGSVVNWRLDLDRVGEVPEPSAWTLMILGFGAAGSAMRRQRRFA